jgi:hypothetical protein
MKKLAVETSSKEQFAAPTNKGVQAGANSCAALSQLVKTWQGALYALNACSDLEQQAGSITD